MSQTISVNVTAEDAEGIKKGVAELKKLFAGSEGNGEENGKENGGDSEPEPRHR
jgi:hypothetical protein